MSSKIDESLERTKRMLERRQDKEEQAMRDARNRTFQSKQMFNDKIYKDSMMSLESQKLEESKKFNELYKKRLDDLEQGAKGDHIRSWISIGIAFLAFLTSAASIFIPLF